MMGHKDTTEELQECCADLKVLGKREFKQLIKWRVGVVKALAAKEKAAKAEVVRSRLYPRPLDPPLFTLAPRKRRRSRCRD